MLTSSSSYSRGSKFSAEKRLNEDVQFNNECRYCLSTLAIPPARCCASRISCNRKSRMITLLSTTKSSRGIPGAVTSKMPAFLRTSADDTRNAATGSNAGVRIRQDTQTFPLLRWYWFRHAIVVEHSCQSGRETLQRPDMVLCLPERDFAGFAWYDRPC